MMSGHHLLKLAMNYHWAGCQLVAVTHKLSLSLEYLDRQCHCNNPHGLLGARGHTVKPYVYGGAHFFHSSKSQERKVVSYVTFDRAYLASLCACETRLLASLFSLVL